MRKKNLGGFKCRKVKCTPLHTLFNKTVALEGDAPLQSMEKSILQVTISPCHQQAALGLVRMVPTQVVWRVHSGITQCFGETSWEIPRCKWMGVVRDAGEQHALGLRISPADTLRLFAIGEGRHWNNWEVKEGSANTGKVHDLEWSQSSSAVQTYG